MDYLNNLDRELVQKICKEIYLNDHRTRKSLLDALIASKYNDEHAFLVVDGLWSAGYLDFEGEKMIDVGDAQQKLKDRGYL